MRVAPLTIAAAVLFACGPVVRASDGSVGGTSPGGSFTALSDGTAAALATSAARDIPCDRSRLSLVSASPEWDLFAVEGCGQRVTYAINQLPDERRPTVQLVLIARLALGAGASGGEATGAVVRVDAGPTR